MSPRRFATGAALAIAGLVAAVGIGLLANSISGDNVGLSAEPLSAGETLAPHADDRGRKRASQRAARERARKREAARRRAHEAAQQPADTVEVPAPGPAPTATTFDDHGGLRDGSDDNSGSGSGSSGSGSGGSDDSGKIDDD
jgi:hypothetical protein